MEEGGRRRKTEEEDRRKREGIKEVEKEIKEKAACKLMCMATTGHTNAQRGFVHAHRFVVTIEFDQDVSAVDVSIFEV